MNIDSIVRVNITKEISGATSRDLNTIAILSEHEVFEDDYRIYTSALDMLDDGFLSTDYAYIAANRIFSTDSVKADKVVVGVKATADTYVQAITKLQGLYNQWIFLITDAATDAEKEAIADFIEPLEKIYVTKDSNPVTLTSATTDLGSKLTAKNLNYTIVMHVKDSTVVAPEAALVGRYAPHTVGSIVWNYKELVGLTSENYTTTEVTNLQAKNVSFYTNVEGNDVVIGGKVPSGELISTIHGILWLKIRIRESVFGLIISKNKINYTNAGITLIESALRDVLQIAVNQEILTDESPITVTVPNALNLTSAKRATHVLSDIKFRARLAGAILYVNGIEGTVYE